MKNIQLHIFELLQQVYDSPRDQDLRIELADHLSECAECAEYLKLSNQIQNAAQIRFTSSVRGARSNAQMIDSVKQSLLHRQFNNRLFSPLSGIAWIIVAIALVVVISLGINLLRPRSIVPVASYTKPSTPAPSTTEINQVTKYCRSLTYTINQRDTLLAIAIYFNVPVDTLYTVNTLENNPVLTPGKTLVIPFCGWTPPLYSKSPDQYGVTPIKDCPIVSYTVLQGDTLEAISVAFNQPIASIVNENQLDNSPTLSPGKSLVITVCKNP